VERIAQEVARDIRSPYGPETQIPLPISVDFRDFRPWSPVISSALARLLTFGNRKAGPYTMGRLFPALPVQHAAQPLPALHFT
jgi:hypothetical protein